MIFEGVFPPSSSTIQFESTQHTVLTAFGKFEKMGNLVTYTLLILLGWTSDGDFRLLEFLLAFQYYLF